MLAKRFTEAMREDAAALGCVPPDIEPAATAHIPEMIELIRLLDARMAQFGLDPAHYQWYRDFRRYGTVPHAGFGLGFERLVVYVCGLSNIRDAIPYPRTPGHAEF